MVELKYDAVADTTGVMVGGGLSCPDCKSAAHPECKEDASRYGFVSSVSSLLNS